MTEPTDRDRRLLEAIDHIGPVSLYALTYHEAADAFDTDADLERRVEELAADGYLRRRTLPDVTGDPVAEYETTEDWGGDEMVTTDG